MTGLLKATVITVAVVGGVVVAVVGMAIAVAVLDEGYHGMFERFDSDERDFAQRLS